jgi:hypothetical protein
MDEKMLAAYNIYVVSKAKMSSYSDMGAFCRTERDRAEVYGVSNVGRRSVSVHLKIGKLADA